MLSIVDLWNDLQLDRYERIALYAVVFMGIVFIGLLMLGWYLPHQEAIGAGSFDASFEWPVPVGSPEIGVRPDGTVGTLNAYGRISSV